MGMRKVSDIRKNHIQGEWETPAALYVNDYLRLTLYAADPMIVAILVECIFEIPYFEVVSMRNKYLGTLTEIAMTGSPSILMNIQVRAPGLPPHIMEAQVYLDK